MTDYLVMNRKTSIRLLIVPIFYVILMMTGCDAITPTRSLPSESQPPVFIAPTFLPTQTPFKTASTPDNNASGSQVDCTNDLKYLRDLTLPDGTQVNPGVALEKEWQVKNSGTCNWSEGYTLRLISGPDLGALSPQDLVPAVNSMKAVIRLQITSPFEPGRFTSTWQAFDPQGNPFGEWFSVEIVVINP